MATATINRSDLWPVGTSVGIYPAGAHNPGGSPGAAAIASGVVDAAGALSVTDAGILSGTQYVAAASVGGEWRYAKLRSTLDTFDKGVFTATGDTTSGSATVANASASAGTIQAGMRISGAGIPGGTYILAVSGGTLTLSAAATASATGVALSGESAYSWYAKLRRRKIAIGTT
jgi:hypothetical protein